MRFIAFIGVLLLFLISGCGRDENSSVAGTSSVSEKKALFKLVAYGANSSSCKVQLVLYNRSNQKIDAMSFGVVGYTDYSRKTGYWRTEYVSPKGDTDFFYERLGGDCYNKCKIEIQGIEFCKIGGKIYSDCFEYLEVESNDSKCSISKAVK